MAGWDIALDEQNALVHSFATQDGRDALLGFAEQIASSGQKWLKDDKPMGDPPPDEDRLKSAMDMTLVAAVSAREGEPIFVGKDVVDLVEFAAESFKPEPVRPDDLMIPNGFMWLERPLYLIDRHEKMTAFRAISWMQSDLPGVAMAFWSHIDDSDDYFPAGLSKEGYGKVGGTPLVLMHVTNVQYGSDALLNDDPHRDLLQTMQCMWRLMQQRIIARSTGDVSRAVWRRKTNWRQIKQVVVMTLRRAKPKHDEPTGAEIEWSHRWWVNPYWAVRHVRDESGQLVSRQVLVSGHPKGPENKEFVPKQRVVEFTR